jgi:hypothetical protein
MSEERRMKIKNITAKKCGHYRTTLFSYSLTSWIKISPTILAPKFAYFTLQ